MSRSFPGQWELEGYFKQRDEKEHFTKLDVMGAMEGEVKEW